MAESAVCGVPDYVRGEAVLAFVVPTSGFAADCEALRRDLAQKVRDEISAIAVPRRIHFVSKLPKTRSGKIMRRLIKAIASGNPAGDLSTLEDRTAVAEIQDAVGSSG